MIVTETDNSLRKEFLLFIVRFSSSNYTFVCFLVENKHVGVVCRSLTPTSLRGGVVSSWMRTKLSKILSIICCLEVGFLVTCPISLYT